MQSRRMPRRQSVCCVSCRRLKGGRHGS
ncbi:hypothetical protein HNR29_007447 [Rhizobium leguminosarum]|nr:hypothetical protein [Rhizobium leguminosarum]